MNYNNNRLVVGVDATRNRSGGAIAHIKGLISGADPIDYGVSKVHLWTYDSLADQLQDCSWLVKHVVPETRGHILRQLYWQRFILPKDAESKGVDVLFNTDAGSLCGFRPCATLSQDMLSYEPGEISRYPFFSKKRVRLEVLRIVQLHRLRRSDVAVFLSNYAQKVIGKDVNHERMKVISHGIDSRFTSMAASRTDKLDSKNTVNCLYVSNIAPYKHQWHVVEAVATLRATINCDVRVKFVGGGDGPALEKFELAVEKYDPNREFVEFNDFLPNDMILTELVRADLFIFASSCENLPVTLLEAMAVGIPVVSSDRGPMPEVLGEDGAYFDPESPESLCEILTETIMNSDKRRASSADSIRRASGYNWSQCAKNSWTMLSKLGNGE